MSQIPILLILVSAFLHIGWNVLGKRAEPTPGFFFLANTAGCLLLLLPVAIYFSDLLAIIDIRVLGLACVAGFFTGANYWALSQAYRHGHISIAYPLARSVPVLIVAAVMFFAGFRDVLNSLFAPGAVLIVAGSILLPMKHFRDLRWNNYRNRATLFALLAAVTTAGYSVVDSVAINRLAGMVDRPGDTVAVTLIYALLEGSFASVWMSAVVLRTASHRRHTAMVWRGRSKAILVAGVGIHLTYALVLVSMSMVENVSYIVAFRQISIPLGVLFGILVFREPGTLPKILGVLAMFTGVVLVASV